MSGNCRKRTRRTTGRNGKRYESSVRMTLLMTRPSLFYFAPGADLLPAVRRIAAILTVVALAILQQVRKLPWTRFMHNPTDR